MNQSLNGRTFYQICPNNDKFYKTIFVKLNQFTGALQPYISEAIEGTPPDGMEPIQPVMLQKLLRLQMSSCFS